ncbi:ABC transporter permease [Niastella caeni]|uniref:ABC transporter permease n=1 Tax=Niastella caeni TaxID=2569763 RepID=A0A4S8HZJ8_9BACT|nr:ABC transporter permease [Niastella caeni]THU41005.1 ABC transporter permease [Niastella caeni]
MNKILLVIQREYLVRVKKKSFLFTTIGVPIIIIGFYAVMIAVGVSGGPETNKIAVIDEANLFNGNIDKAKDDGSEYVFISNQSPDSLKVKYKKLGYDYFLYIPPIEDFTKNVSNIQLFSKSPVAMKQKRKIEKTINSIIEQKRLQSANISREQYRSIKSDVSIDNKIVDGKEEKKGVAAVATIVSFVCGILIYMLMLIYGTMVMRGVMEEKLNRIAEVMVSSVKPFQLMLGKIIGIGAVGLTQFAIWIVLIVGLQFILSIFIPSFDLSTLPQTGQGAGAMAENVSKMDAFRIGFHSVPWGLIIFSFIFYFIGGYLLYASLFAAIGSVVSEDQNEAQAMVFPVMMPIVLGFVIMTKAITEPNTPLAIFGSIFPLTSPVVMMGRLMYNVPISQVIISMLLLVLNFIFFAWLSGKIYRTGILMYGKKVTWKEMIRWTVRKS